MIWEVNGQAVSGVARDCLMEPAAGPSRVDGLRECLMELPAWMLCWRVHASGDAGDDERGLVGAGRFRRRGAAGCNEAVSRPISRRAQTSTNQSKRQGRLTRRITDTTDELP